MIILIFADHSHAANAMVCLDYQLLLYPEAADLLQQQDELLEFLRDKGQPGESRLQQHPNDFSHHLAKVRIQFMTTV